MKYLAYYEDKMYEFESKGEYLVFINDKPNIRHKSCKTKKEEEAFRELCKKSPVFEKKIYVGIENGTSIRFDSWAECQAYKKLHPTMIVKSFTDNGKAQEFNNVNIHKNSIDEVLIAVIPLKTLNGKADDVAFVLHEGGKEKYRENLGSLASLPYWERELKIVIKAIKKAIEFKEERITIIYNNQGVELWANGSWKASKPQTIAYKEEIDKLSPKINIDFVNRENLEKNDEFVKKVVDSIF